MTRNGPGSGTLRETLATMRAEFVAGLRERAQEIESARRELERTGEPKCFERLFQLVHRLSGSGATFGHPEISAIALEVETGLRAVEGPEALTPAASSTLTAELDRLVEACSRAAEGPVPKIGEIEVHLAAAQRDSSVLLVVEDDAHLAAQLSRQLQERGFEVAVASRPAGLCEIVTRIAPACVLMDIVFAEGRLAGAEAVTSMQATCTSPPPVIFFSSRDDLEARLAAVRAGGAAYFTKPIDMPALAERIDTLSGRRPQSPYRILLVDDDAQLAALYARMLEAAGMRTQVVVDPLAVLSELVALEPDLVLLDYHMPGCSGPELARALRQVEGHASLPILFLSTESDQRAQLQALDSGGDEFLTKPIAPEDLTFAVASRARRGREIQGLLERDAQTRVLNHVSLKRCLELEIKRARRQVQPLCFAMLDLDRFKRINDTCGHPAGDRVIRIFANLLVDRLRRTDVVGRYGGDELAVILPATRGEEGARLFDGIRQHFAAMNLGGKHGLAVTFSCGLATFPDQPDLTSLLDAADAALYAAKSSGRNRVELARRLA